MFMLPPCATVLGALPNRIFFNLMITAAIFSSAAAFF